MELESSDSQESHNVTLSTDVASTVFNFAPYWVFSSTWHCQHPSDNSSEASYIQFSEPQTTEEVLQLYRNRQMKGSNLVVGLASSTVASGTIPSSFCRTLAYVFEVAKSGSNYHPVTQDDLARGSPMKGWCEPLWLRSSEGGFSTDTRSSEEIDPAEVVAQKSDPAYHLLMSAPFWCYLYNHEPTRAKKTPPKEAEQMLEMFRSGCLPEWTPVLGLQHDVSTFNSLPPSLFMPLGALLHLTATGLPCKPVGLTELTRWDKFIGQRTSTGCTQGVLQPGGSARGGGRSGSQTAPHVPASVHNAASGVSAPNGQATHMGSNYYPSQHNSQQPSGYYGVHVNYMPYQMHPGAQMYNPGYGAPSNPANPNNPMHMMWGFGQYPGNSPGQTAFVPSQPPAAFNSRQAVPDSNTSHQIPSKNLQVAHAEGQGWGPLGPSQRKGKRHSGKKSGHALNGTYTHNSMPSGGPQMPVPVVNQGSGNPLGTVQPGRLWESALFRLFTADATRGAANATWWRVVPGSTTPMGPFGCEQMIVEYARGILLDSHLACGTTSDACHIVPSLDLFESVGSLLSQVDAGGHYVLVTLAEVMESNSMNASSQAIPAAYELNQEVPRAAAVWGSNDGSEGPVSGRAPKEVGALALILDADAAATVKTVLSQQGTTSPTKASSAARDHVLKDAVHMPDQ